MCVRTTSRRARGWWAVAALGVALLPGIASAALGEAEATVASDAERLNGSIKSTERSTYRIHEIQLSSGTLVREYSTSAGTVFAVAWSGPTIPDLRQTLGQYFASYTTAARAPHGGHHHLQIRQEGFVMEAGGHMRAFAGRAYLPQNIPPGISTAELH
jgi:hypothetical protein